MFSDARMTGLGFVSTGQNGCQCPAVEHFNFPGGVGYNAGLGHAVECADEGLAWHAENGVHVALAALQDDVFPVGLRERHNPVGDAFFE